MSGLLPGFAAAAADAQSCFRAVLEAMSRPGKIVGIAAALTPPAGLGAAAAATLLTLADNTTSVSLPAGTAAAQDWLVFHTGARMAAAQAADFVLAWDRPRLADLRQGSYDEPETSALLILQVPAFEAGQRVRLSGPGIETATRLDLPLDDGFMAEWAAQLRRSPLGIDILLCAAAQVVGLPRSVTVEAV
jgi:alpha-D-ribose 1-methylphosphonate 5-triphosphate synthase subunit PhnH